MSVMVFRYGLLPPTEQAEEVRRQMRAAHKYRNTLTEIERGRRAAVRLVLAESSAEVSALEKAAQEADTRVETAVRTLKAARAASRSRSETQAMRDEIALARVAKRDAVKALKEARTKARTDPTTLAALDAIQERAGELRRSAREYCGVYWGSYLLIEDEAQAAAKAPLYDGAEPNDPRYVRWEGNGDVGVQLQGGMAAEAVFGADTRLHIDSVDEKAWYSEKRGERRRLCRTMLSMRVGSTPERQPVWARWPMLMHRPMPRGGMIKRATVSLRKRGPREEWSVQLTVDTTDAVRPQGPEASGTIAIDLGWRQMGDHLRVATWADDEGKKGEVVLDARMIGALKKASELRSIRDDNFNRARDQLAAWLKDRVVPAWLADATKHLSQWRSAGRLAQLALQWRKARFEDDKEGYDPLEAWRYHDHHLWEWEASQRTKSLRRRRELYRIFAADITTRYEKVVIEKFDLRALAKRQAAEAPKAENETARSNRQLVAVSELRGVILNAASARGREVAVEDAAYTTRTCHACGSVEQWDQAAYVNHTCGSCGVLFDQDENAANNLLARHRDRLQKEAEQGTGGEKEEVKESRWVRAKRLRSERDARKEQQPDAE